ncbi:MAG: SUMF1/EgtB/PvdO family nonheme iron enzyme, partial [Magnetococcales bacterium]|nr:SUMF1/EgtB/PvdO family nonheme iron enzyme [Magnetococcales bacterium]
VVASTLFMDNWRVHPNKDHPNLKIPRGLIWTDVDFSIKHGEQLKGYIQETKEVMERIKVKDVDLTPWLQNLLDQTNTLEIRGIGSGAGRNKDAGRYSIETLYTPLRSRGGGGEATVALADLLPKHSRLLIEGQPGAGKTTFLRLAAAMLCRDILAIPSPLASTWRKEYLGFVSTRPPLVPLFLRLSQLAALLAKDQDLLSADDGRRLLDLLQSLVKPEDDKAWRDHWNGLLERGEVLLLLDGLDEVADEVVRKRVIAIVQETTRRWGKCPMVVTSRPFGVEQMKGLGFQHVVIEPFGQLEIHEFIKRWSAALHEQANEASGVRANHQEILLQAILEKPAIRILAANPVMLTCLCVVHWNEGQLPEGRARVYQAVIRWLIAARSDMRVKAGFGDQFTLEAFTTLALAMMTVNQGKKQAVFDVQDGAEAVESLVARYFSELKNKPERLRTGRQWLAFECLGSGIVEELGDQRIKFWHLTFQEYLAAQALAWLGDEEKPGEDFWPILKQKLDDPQWRETVELFPGALFDEGGKRRVDRLLQRVLNLRGKKPTLEDDARVAGIMGRLLQPMIAYQYIPKVEIGETYQQVLNRAMAIFTKEGAKQVPIKQRIAAAEALGRGGDPRLQDLTLIDLPGTGWKLGKYPVTVWEFQQFVDDGGYKEQSWWDDAGWQLRKELESPGNWDEQLLHPNRPVTDVSWFEAMAYCRWLSKQRGEIIRLPDETVWQKAATSPKGKYPWGADEPTQELANFGGNVGSPTPVGLYPAGDGPLGHCDLAGNVWEWCRNIGENEKSLETPLDPVVKESDSPVWRGGSWGDGSGNLGLVFCDWNHAKYRLVIVGFRVAAAPASL